MKKRNRYVFLLFLVLLVLSCAEIQRLSPPVTVIPVSTPPLVIYNSLPDAEGQPVSNPSVAVDRNGAINVVWWSRGFGEVFFSRSTDGGKSFSKALDISNTPLGSDHPVVAVDPKGTIYVIWDDGSVVPFFPEILFVRSTDGGRTWSAPKNISNTPVGASTRSNIAVDSTGAINVIWLDAGGVLFTRSTDGGDTWMEPKFVSEKRLPNGTFPPSVAVDKNGRIYIAWSVPNSLSYIVHSADGGATFTPPNPISETRPTLNPGLAVDRDGNVYAVWSDGTSGTAQVMFAWSKDRGATFSPSMNVSKSDRVLAMEPRIVVDPNGTIWAAWTQIFPSGIAQVFMAHSVGGRHSFSQPMNLSETTGKGWLPNLAVGPTGEIEVVWEHGMKEAIFYSKIIQQVVPVRSP